MTISHPIKSDNSGFTLIELSIVLVIIGLIVGGILTGQDLIKAAEQRATIAQIEKFNTAVNTFRGKYGYIPGDIPFATANSFNLGAGTGSTTLTAGGDGNGLLQDAQANNGNTPFGEELLFWSQLSLANLIDGSFGSSTSDVSAAAQGGGTTANNFPLAKLGRGNYIIVGADDTNGFNAYALAAVGATYTGGASGTAKYAAGTDNLNPLEAYSMDKKVDDGMPNTGTVQARTSTALGVITQAQSPLENLTATNGSTSAATATSGKCQTGNATVTTVSNTYNVTYGSVPSCSLRFRFN